MANLGAVGDRNERLQQARAMAKNAGLDLIIKPDIPDGVQAVLLPNGQLLVHPDYDPVTAAQCYTGLLSM